jgi:hypothetical protein
MSTALRDVLKADGVLNNTEPNGPELILAAREYVKTKKRKKK